MTLCIVVLPTQNKSCLVLSCLGYMYEEKHNVSNEFEFRPDPITNYGVVCPGASGKIPIDLVM